MIMKKKITSLLLIGVAFIVASSSCSSKDDKPAGPPPSVAVNVYTVTKQPAVFYDAYPATVVALNQVDLRAQETGYITGIYFSDGQQVKKGQKLYDIDKQQYEANFNNATANLNVAKSNQDKAQQDADRYNDLLKQDAIAKQVVDHAISDLQSAKMQVAASTATVARAQTDLNYSTIYAPFDGTIGISLVKLGTLVTANQTLLNTVSSNNPMAVDVAIDQKEIVRFEKLQQGSTPTDSVFTLALGDSSIYPQNGSISFIDRAVDPQTGTIKLRLIFPNQDNTLKSGMNGNLRVKNNFGDTGFLMIPYKSVVEQLGEYFVYLANKNKAIQHKVVLGTRINDKVIVKSGLQEGDSVITEGVQKLRDSVAIQLGAPKPPPSADKKS
jgi:RND family efflux transporter MFP subunit